MMSEEVNTKLYSLEELKQLEYGKLLVFSNNLNNIIEEFENIRFGIEIDNDDFSEEEISDLAFIDAQLRYLYQNYNNSLIAMEYHEDKIFCLKTDLLDICLN